MPFKFTFDNTTCIQCGICGDACPVNALDFTRPRHAHVEDEKKETDQTTFMTEYPIQVSKCTGCMICPNECPVSCIEIVKTDREPRYQPKQGPMLDIDPAKDEFALSKYTKARPYKVKVRDPWGHEYIYRPLRRKSNTQTWESHEEMR
ncbi:MAG: 4Fe-4S dicluster domain-containing protein [Candidatus Micrarchaeota archaeon]|nr:4Fe-4S dicluster domain-containing protein [Candidatus Micrarchaeota archaeon]